MAGAFLCRGAHQRHLRIVLVESTADVLLGHRLRGAEVHHVERADRADVGHAGADDGAEAVLGRRKDAAHHHVADFGRGEVDHAGTLPLSMSFSIDCPPMPVAWKTRQS
jgi:hypothetical protein